jgi:hypothetical protein
MAYIYSAEEIQEILPQYLPKHKDTAIALAHLTYDLNIKPCCITKSNIPFKERKFWRHLRSVRRGDGNGKRVFLLFVYFK